MSQFSIRWFLTLNCLSQKARQVQLVFYELFTGVQGDSVRSLPPREENSYLPIHIDRAIRKCVEEDPKDRFKSVSELKMALATDKGVSGAEADSVRRWRGMVIRIATICALFAALLIGGFLVVQKNRQPAPGMRQDDEINSLAFSPDGHLLASASEDKTVVLWDVANQRRIHTLADHIRAVTSVAFSSNGRWLASGSADKTIKVWDVETGRLAYTLNDSKEILTVALSRDGRWLASASDESVKVWDVPAGRIARILHHADAVLTLAFGADGRLLASGSSDSTVRVWAVETGHLVAGPLNHDDTVEAVTFSPDGHLLASASLDRTIKLWSTTSWVAVQTLWHGAQVSDLGFNPDGSRLMSMSNDGKVRLWEAPTWRESGSLMANERDTTWTSAFSPDGGILAVGTTDGAIKLQSLRALSAHK